MEPLISEWKRFAVEFVISAFMFGWSTTSNVMTDLIVYQTCKTMSNLNYSTCDILHENSSSKEAMIVGKLVQPITAPIVALKSFIEIFFPALLVLFLGPWSDKNGRKLLMILPLIGGILCYSGYAIMSTLNINSYYLLIPTTCLSILGGNPLISLATFCWVTDITPNDSKAWRLARLEMAILFGIVTGFFTSSFVFKHWGYIPVFSLSAIICFIALICVLTFVDETIVIDRQSNTRCTFNLSSLRQLYDSVSKKRDGFDKFIVCSCIAFLAMYQIEFRSFMSISFLFTSSHLGWNLSEYCLFSGIRLIIYISGLFILVKIFALIFKLSDITIIITACLSAGVSSLVKAFVTKSWHIYVSGIIGMFSRASTPVIKSIMSKTIPQNDVGKVFSLSAIVELIVPLATEPIYIFVYVHTLNVYPCPVWFLSALLCLVMILLAITIEWKWRKFKKTQYDRLATAGN